MGPNKKKIEYALRLQFPTINNIVEYKALILIFELAWEVGAQFVKVYSDSQLVIKQVNEWCEAK